MDLSENGRSVKNACELVYSVCPYGLNVISLSGQLLHIAAVGQHGIDLRGRPALRGEHQMHAVRRPPRVLVTPAALRQLHWFAGGYVHHKNIEISRLITPGPGKSDLLTAGAPRG